MIPIVNSHDVVVGHKERHDFSEIILQALLALPTEKEIKLFQ